MLDDGEELVPDGKRRPMKKLQIRRIDLVARGANYNSATGEGAWVMLAKRRDGDEPSEIPVLSPDVPVLKMRTKIEDGQEYPASAYAYVPEPGRPSTWKLRLWESPQKRVTRTQVARAIQAIEPEGFRGQRAEIPAEQMPHVRARLRAAWTSVADDDEAPSSIRKDGLISRVVEKIGRAISGDRMQRLSDAHKTIGEVLKECSPGEDDHGEKEKAMLDEMSREAVFSAAAKYLDRDGKDDVAAVLRASLETPVMKALAGLNAEARAAVTVLQEEQAVAIAKMRSEHAATVAKASELEARLAQQVVDRDRERFVAKSRADFGHLSGDSGSLGGALHEVSAKLPDVWAVLEPVLKSADAMIAHGHLFDTIGVSGGETSGDAWTRIEKMAQERVVAQASTSFPVAVDEVLRADPGLYTEYLAEQQAGERK